MCCSPVPSLYVHVDKSLGMRLAVHSCTGNEATVHAHNVNTFLHTMFMYQELSHCHGNLGAKSEVMLHDWSPQVQVPLSQTKLLCCLRYKTKCTQVPASKFL